MSTPDVLREIRRATRPYGVTTAEKLDLTDRQRQHACANGVLERPYPGVLVDPATPRTPHRDLLAAVLAGGRMAAAWGRSAGWLCELLDEPPACPEIVVPLRRYARIEGVVVRRSSDLCPAHITTWKHIPTTKPLVTAVDLGVELTPMELAEAYVRARQRKLFEPSAVQAMLGRIAKPGRDGVRTARDALTLVMIGERPADSILELRFHHGPGRSLPPYQYQYPVRVDGKDYRIDFAYPEVMLAIELDGYEKRKSREALRRDARRLTALAKAGWTVAHFTWEDVNYAPDRVVADVLWLLRAGGYTFCR
jgi:very-short-patch-repair endonuclease